MLSPYQKILDKLNYADTLEDIWQIAVDFFKRNDKRAGNRKSDYKRHCYISIIGQKAFTDRGIIPQRRYKI